MYALRRLASSALRSDYMPYRVYRQFQVNCGGARGSEFVRIMPMMPSLIYTYFSPLSVLSNCDEHIIHENVAKRATKSTRGR